MSFKETIKKLEKRGLVSRKPKPIFVFLLFFAYFLLWLLTFILYMKFDMKSLQNPMTGLTIIMLLTLAHAIFHYYAVKNLES